MEPNKKRLALGTCWQLFDKLPRPLLRFACIFGAVWAMGLGDALGLGLDNTARGIVLGFVLSIYGVREFGKIKGVA